MVARFPLPAKQMRGKLTEFRIGWSVDVSNEEKFRVIEYAFM